MNSLQDCEYRINHRIFYICDVIDMLIDIHQRRRREKEEEEETRISSFRNIRIFSFRNISKRSIMIFSKHDDIV